MPLWFRRALVVAVPLLVILLILVLPRLGGEDASRPTGDNTTTSPATTPTETDGTVVPDPGTSDPATDTTPRSDDGDPQAVIPDPPAGEDAENQSSPMPDSTELLGEVRGPTPPAQAAAVGPGLVVVRAGRGTVQLAGRSNPRQVRGTVREGGVGQGAGALALDADMRLRGPGLAEIFVGDATIDVATGRIWASFHDGQMYPYLQIPTSSVRLTPTRIRIVRAPVRLTTEGRENLRYWNARAGAFTGVVGTLSLDAPLAGR